MGFKEVKLYRICWTIFGLCALIVCIVILSLQWRKVDVLNYGLLYNTGKKAVELDQLYLPGRYYVGAGSYFLEFPSTQKAIIFKTDSKQAFDTEGAYMAPSIRGLTKDGLILQMALVVNYKLLDPENTAVAPQNQLHSIFNKLYGGNIEEEISDSVQLIAEAGIMETITQYFSNEFYEKRGDVQWSIYLRIRELLKDYYITCSGVSIVNMEFDSAYQNAIAKISAETQLIEEKNNLYLAEQIAAQMRIEVATINKDILVSQAQNDGAVYTVLTTAKATAVMEFYGKVNDTLPMVRTMDNTPGPGPAYNFYYMLALKMSPSNKNLYLYQTKATYDPINT